MKRRDFCKALGLSAVGGLLLTAGSAAAAQPVGHAVPDGTYPLPFLSILSNLDIIPRACSTTRPPSTTTSWPS